MLDFYRSGQVRRYHANPVMARFMQTDADHQWGCAILILHLHPNPSLNLITAALKHDAGELLAGDVPYPFKERFPSVAAEHAKVEKFLAQSIGMGMPALTDNEAAWLRFVDRLESVLYASIYAPEVLLRPDWASSIESILSLAESLSVREQTSQLVERLAA